MHLDSIINEVCNIFRSDSQKKNIKYGVHINQGERLIATQSSKLQLVLFNILSNAFKYTEGGEINVEADILSSEELEGF